MKIATAQMFMGKNVRENLDKTFAFMRAAAGCDLIFFPEIQLTPFFPQYPGRNADRYVLDTGGPEVREICDCARETGVYASPLEIEEKNEADYRSQNPGLMHACGHDAHTAALLTAAKLLKERREQLPGTVKLIFQPAEEIGRGAASVIATGVLGDVDAFFGIHVRAGLPVGKVALKAGAAMAGANSLKIAVNGKSGHAGHPDEAIDAITAGCALVEALQHIVSREVSPTEPAVVSVCQFHAGTRDNIIANLAEISGTVRVTSEQARAQVAEAVRRVVAGVSQAHRVTSEVKCDFATPILLNSAELYPIAVQAAENFLPADAVESFVPKLGTEDFSVYGGIAPAFFAFVGSGGQYPHHHERFDIEEEALAVLAALHVSFAFRYFEHYKKK